MKRVKFPIILMAVLSLVVFSCDDDDDDMMMEDNMLTLIISNLVDLGDAERYEGWIVVNGVPVSTGTFTVNGSGMMSQNQFTVDTEDLAAATDFVLSVEPFPDNNPAPSAIKILGGVFAGNSAPVSVSHNAALGNNFASASGKYILATPTTTTMEDELSGIWFLDLSSGAPVVGLNLPVLPMGWKYEGWAVVNGMPVSSGTFSDVDSMDDSAPFSGMDASGPPFPGEDYVMNAPTGLIFPTDLSGATLVISIEPNPDNSSSPFQFKPLVANVPMPASDHITYDFTSMVSQTFPSGTVAR